MNRSRELRRLLIELEAELKALELWQSQPPSAEALASTEPFCVDTLSLSQWLQWLAIPRFHALLDGNMPLPTQCNISAIAEESFKDMEQDCARLLAIIADIDATLTN